MAANTNVVVLRGRLTRDPEARQVGDKTVVGFALAVNGYGDKVAFVDVEAWGKTAEIIQSYVTKGKLITVTGRLDQQRWEKDGQKRSKTLVVAGGVELDPRGSAAGEITTDDGFEPAPALAASEDIPF